jgi:adenylate cyclase class 2
MMTTVEVEVEVKLYLSNLSGMEKRLKQARASIFQPRIFELNLRFDTPDGSLTHGSRVLRLRQDAQAVMTYKGPNQPTDGVSVRQEIEFIVGDLTAARHLLEALGYQVNVIYEKYRSTYLMDEVKVTLDEMPYGNFVEVEGPDPESIRSVAEKLCLVWDARVADSYLSLFNRLKTTRGFEFRDLTFANFAGLSITPEELGVRPADLGCQ